MRSVIKSLIVGGVFVGGTITVVGQVAAPEVRESVLVRAERFEVVELDEIQGRFESVANPFYPNQPKVDEPGIVVESNEPPPPSDRDVLQAVTPRINPSGLMRFGSKVHLLFGESRIKAGDFISVTYQGNEYSLQLVKVDSREFVLRLNEEVISKRIQ